MEMFDIFLSLAVFYTGNTSIDPVFTLYTEKYTEVTVLLNLHAMNLRNSLIQA
jgi:hypothetical protein